MFNCAATCAVRRMGERSRDHVELSMKVRMLLDKHHERLIRSQATAVSPCSRRLSSSPACPCREQWRQAARTDEASTAFLHVRRRLARD
jgi:hypothetical protein